ncbi:O-antigen ligase family protein [Wenzhouxiangella sp. AB-CW3]|uniref:O-antigen ligase family protein n=1 Tax=Wenzhouxiangella sp. AB-CW3 TaxID=2771012 RepID=UPI00168BEB9D|nr:O-antigen ligase family protein [Wenzhouxiangella sp. AB-CW3]QOC21840.1 O-antigen ligase family protein [Wenzhouxiangella sp. AB-CW3]
MSSSSPIRSDSATLAADHGLARACGLILFATLALALVVPGVLAAGYFSLGLIAIVWLTRQRAWRDGVLSRHERWLVWSLLIFVSVWVLSWAVHGFTDEANRAAGRIARLLPMIPVFLLLRRMQGLDGWMWRGLIAGGLIAGGYALWFVLSGQSGVHHVGQTGFRVEGTTNPIYFGGISLAFALMLVPKVIDDRETTLLRNLALLAIVLAFVANALSGSRGAWLAVPVLIVIYFFTLGVRQTPLWRFGTPLALLGLSLLALTAPMLPMHERLSETWIEIRLIGEGLGSDGAIGLRLKMWSVAWAQFLDNPWLGAGPGAYRDVLHQAAEANDWNPIMLRYRHPHNEYLSALTNAGIPGLLSFVAMLGLAGLRFARHLWTAGRDLRFMAWCGLAATVTLAVMAGSESIFERNTGVIWFALLVATTSALLTAAGRRQSSNRQSSDCPSINKFKQ